MPIAKITGQGLVAISISVGLLWGCLIGDRIMTRQAFRERVRVMHEIEIFQHRFRPEPASTPVPHIVVRPRVSNG
jgi:hypothetical protein